MNPTRSRLRPAGDASTLGNEPANGAALAVIGLLGLGLAAVSLRSRGGPRSNPTVTLTSRNADREATFKLSKAEFETLDSYRDTGNASVAGGMLKISKWWLE